MGATAQSITARVATYLRDGSPQTTAAIAQALDVSRTSAKTAVEALTDLRLLSEATQSHSAGAGRPAKHYSFNGDAAIVAGVDVGIHSMRVTLANLSGVIIAHEHFSGVHATADAATQLDQLAEAVYATLAKASRDASALRAMGIALPGIVDAYGQVTASVVLPTWPGIDVAGTLADRFGCDVVIDNGVRLAAIAEHHCGAARLVDDVLYVSVGARIAAGIILEGKPRRGSHNIAGDIGRVAFRGIDENTGALSWRSAESAEAVFDAAAAGSSDAAHELERFTAELGRGIATLVLTIDPAMVVIGGGLSRAADALLVPLRAAIVEHTRIPADLPVVSARLGASAASHGALVYAFTLRSENVYGLADMVAPALTLHAERSDA